MADIIQKLGFDATSAIQQINSLNSALGSLNGNLGKTASGVSAFNNAAQNVQGTTNQVQKLEKQTNSLTISWQTLARVITTRLALGAVNRLREALQEGAKDAIEFGIRIAEIGTIAGKGANLGIIREELLEVSRLSGRGLADVAEGFYQTLSNQVGNATESLKVYNQAVNLSIATNSSLEDSVNLVTAALNGWQLGATQAEMIVGKLFKTIELGRLRVKDLANVLGAVGPMASTMGVSIEETLGTLANMTIQGTRSTKAITQLRAIMTQMLKPTKELQELMREEWGVANAEQAILLFGSLNNVIRELDKISGGASDEMAKFFSNVRALSGIFAQTANIDKTTKALQDLNDAGSELSGWASGLVMETPAKKAEVAINKLKIEFQEMGNEMLPVITMSTNALSILSRELGAIALAIGAAMALGFIAHLGSISKAALMAAKSTSKLGLVVNGAGLAIAFLVGFELGKWLINADKQTQSLVNSLESLSESISDRIVSSMTIANKKLADLRKEDLQNATRYFAKRQKLVNELEDTVKNEAKATQDTTEDSLAVLLKLQTNYVRKLEQVHATSATTIQKSEENSLKIRRGIEQKQFDWSVEGLEGLGASFARINRSKSKLSEALSIINKQGITPDQLERARDLLAIASQEAGGASQAASSVEDVRQSRVALIGTRKQELAVQNAQLQLENRTVQLAKQQAAIASAGLKNQRDKLKNLKADIAIVTKGVTAFDVSTGKRKDRKQDKRDRDAARKAFSRIRASFTDKDLTDILSITDILGLDKLGQQLTSQFKTLPALGVNIEANYQSMKTKLEAESAKTPIKLVVALTTLGMEDAGAATPSEQSKFLAKTGKELEQQGAEISGIRAQIVGIDTAINEIPPLKDKLAVGPDGVSRLGNLVKGYNKLVDQTKQLKKLDPVSPKALELTKQLRMTTSKWLDEYEKIFLTDTFGGKAIEKIASLMGNNIQEAKKSVQVYLGLLTKVGQKQLELQKSDPTGSVLKQFEQREALFKQAIQQPAGAGLAGRLQELVLTPIEQVRPTMFLQDLNTLSQLAGEIQQKIASATATPIQVIHTHTPQKLAVGGLVNYYSKGGFTPRGTDTVPAMLTPGEFVVNAKSTRKFYSELVAMNSGRKPIYRAMGGPVSNQTIGDININVKGGATSDKTIREIGPALRRELRRNNLILR